MGRHIEFSLPTSRPLSELPDNHRDNPDRLDFICYTAFLSIQGVPAPATDEQIPYAFYGAKFGWLMDAERFDTDYAFQLSENAWASIFMEYPTFYLKLSDALATYDGPKVQELMNYLRIYVYENTVVPRNAPSKWYRPRSLKPMGGYD